MKMSKCVKIRISESKIAVSSILLSTVHATFANEHFADTISSHGALNRNSTAAVFNGWYYTIWVMCSPTSRLIKVKPGVPNTDKNEKVLFKNIVISFINHIVARQ